MSSLGSPSTLFLGKKKAYEVERSLRFNDGDGAYLQRTVSSSSNRKTFTFSFWVKRSTLGTEQRIFMGDDGGSGEDFIQFKTDDKIKFALIFHHFYSRYKILHFHHRNP